MFQQEQTQKCECALGGSKQQEHQQGRPQLVSCWDVRNKNKYQRDQQGGHPPVSHEHQQGRSRRFSRASKHHEHARLGQSCTGTRAEASIMSISRAGLNNSHAGTCRPASILSISRARLGQSCTEQACSMSISKARLGQSCSWTRTEASIVSISRAGLDDSHAGTCRPTRIMNISRAGLDDSWIGTRAEASIMSISRVGYAPVGHCDVKANRHHEQQQSRPRQVLQWDSDGSNSHAGTCRPASIMNISRVGQSCCGTRAEASIMSISRAGLDASRSGTCAPACIMNHEHQQRRSRRFSHLDVRKDREHQQGRQAKPAS